METGVASLPGVSSAMDSVARYTEMVRQAPWWVWLSLFFIVVGWIVIKGTARARIV